MTKMITRAIVNRGKWLGRPVKIKEASKQAKMYVGRQLTLHAYLLFYAYGLYLARFFAGSVPKIANKNIQQRTLPGFVTIYFYLR